MIQTISQTTPLYFAGRDVITRYVAEVDNPAYVPQRINIYIITDPVLNGTPSYPGTEVKRSLPPSSVIQGVYYATFDINNVLHSEVQQLPISTSFTFPGDPDEPITKHDNYLLPFYIETSYTYIDEDGNYQESDRTDNSSQDRWQVLKGGISFHMEHYLNFKEISFSEWLFPESTKPRWLSWIPNNMPVHPTQPLRLWVFNNVGRSTDITLMVNIKYTDGTSQTESIYTTQGVVGLFEVICGPIELRLITYNISKTVASYDVWLQTGLEILVQAKTFIIDYNYYERNDLMFFTNSLGVNEVLWCHGRRSTNVKTTGEERVQPVTNYAVSVIGSETSGKGSIRAYRPSQNQTHTLNTGFFPKYMRNYLLDLLSAGEGKLPVQFFYMPIIVEPGSFNWGNDKDDLFELSFKAKLANTDHYHSDVPEVESPWGDFNNDFNEDFF